MVADSKSSLTTDQEQDIKQILPIIENEDDEDVRASDIAPED